MAKRFVKRALIGLTFCIPLGCASTLSGESTGEFLDGTVITTKIKSELALDKDTSLHQIDVETFKGKVQLSGFVDSQEEKDAAEAIAANVKGVTSIDNALIVK